MKPENTCYINISSKRLLCKISLYIFVFYYSVIMQWFCTSAIWCYTLFSSTSVTDTYNVLLLIFMWLHIVTVLHLSWVTPQRMCDSKECGSAHRNLLRLSHSSAPSTDHAVSHFASQQTLRAKVLSPLHADAREHISSRDPRGGTLWETISLTPLCSSSCAVKKFAQFPSSGTVMMWVEVGR